MSFSALSVKAVKALVFSFSENHFQRESGETTSDFTSERKPIPKGMVIFTHSRSSHGGRDGLKAQPAHPSPWTCDNGFFRGES